MMLGNNYYDYIVFVMQVLENELQALQKACNELERGYQPGITFIVVQKRHHTKFFPMDDRDKVCTHYTVCSHDNILYVSPLCNYLLIRWEKVGMFHQGQQ